MWKSLVGVFFHFLGQPVRKKLVESDDQLIGTYCNGLSLLLTSNELHDLNWNNSFQRMDE